MIDGAEPLSELTTADLVVIFARTEEAVRAHAPGLDAINVFPVADSDTGANLLAVVAALAAAAVGATSAAALAAALVGPAERAARGHAGTLFGQFVTGWAEDIRNADRIDADRFALALEAGADRARRAMGTPTEGTMLSVIDAASAAALAALDAGGSLARVAAAANDAGLDALERTPDQLPALAEAGVVDAGAAGWLVWLDVVLSHILGDGDPGDLGSGHDGGRPASSVGGRWDIRFRIRCNPAAAGSLSGVLASLGEVTEFEAVVAEAMVADGGSWDVAARADDIGAVIEAALSAGRPIDIRVDEAQTAGDRDRG